MLGISWGAYREKMGPLGTMKYSFIEVGYWIRLTIKSLGMLFTGKASVNDLSGPVGIVDIVDDTVEAAKEDGAFYVFLNVMNLVILLSANVGIMNLLPIPALDGGKLLFLFIEAVRGKPIDKKKEGYVHLAGVIFLLLLMVFIVFNDFRKMIFGV
jgi:regulator of sigma E protease